MFGNLLGDMEERQKKMKESLAEMEITAEAGNGAIKVTANANREILNISIDKEKLDWNDIEEVEDLLFTAVNRALKEAAEKEAEAAQDMLKNMLPPGMGNLGGLF